MEWNDSVTASGIVVEDSNIESVGEENMLTYAGGVFGGVWYMIDFMCRIVLSETALCYHRRHLIRHILAVFVV